MLKRFTLASLADLDGGRIAAALDREVGRCYDDCMDRPALEKPRKVTLEIVLMPEADDSGALASIDTKFKIKPAALPAKESRAYNMLPQNGELLMNELAPDNARQLTLDQTGKTPDLKAVGS